MQRPLAGFLLSTLVVFGSMNFWLLTVSSPFFVFLVFKMLKVWKTKERIVYGVPAIILGIMLFFLAFSFHIVGTPEGYFISQDGSMEATITPYSTDDPAQNFTVEVLYKNITDKDLNFQVKDVLSGYIVARGSVEGVVSNGSTLYRFTIEPDMGLYDITLSVGNEIMVISALKTTPMHLFGIYLKTSGLMISMLLTGLYLLLMYGIHVVRTGYKLGGKYEA